VWDAGGSSTSPPPPSTSGQISSRPARPQAVQHRVLAHVFGVDVTPHPQGVAVVEPGLTAALGAPHQEIAAPVAHQGIGEVGSSSALGRSMKKPSGSIFCNRGPQPAGRTPVSCVPAKVLVWSGLTCPCHVLCVLYRGKTHRAQLSHPLQPGVPADQDFSLSGGQVRARGPVLSAALTCPGPWGADPGPGPGGAGPAYRGGLPPDPEGPALALFPDRRLQDLLGCLVFPSDDSPRVRKGAPCYSSRRYFFGIRCLSPLFIIPRS